MKGPEAIWKNAKCVHQLQFGSLRQKALKLDEIRIKFIRLFLWKENQFKLLKIWNDSCM